MHLASFYDVTYFISLTDASQAFSNQEHPLFYQARGTKELTWLSYSTSPLSPVSIFLGTFQGLWLSENKDLICISLFPLPCSDHSVTIILVTEVTAPEVTEAPAQTQTNTSSWSQGALSPGAWRYLWTRGKNPSPWRFIGYLIRFLSVYVYFHHMLTSVL